MSDNGASAAVAALFSVGIILLNLGVTLIQEGQLYPGLTVILFGAALILAAVLVSMKTMKSIAKRVARNP